MTNPLTTCVLSFGALLVAASSAPAQTEASPPGLTVRDGVLLKDGEPYHGMGMNYFEAFYRTLQDTADKDYEKSFAELGKRVIPSNRLMACGL